MVLIRLLLEDNFLRFQDWAEPVFLQSDLGKQEQEQEVKELAAALFRFGSQKKLEDKEDLILGTCKSAYQMQRS
jgi:hypothetical protein